MSLFGSSNVLSVDFGSNEVKAVEGKYSKKGVVITKTHSMKLPNDIYSDGIIQDMDQLVYLFRNNLLNNKSFSGDVYGVIDSSKIIMREISMPKVEKSQIASIIDYQLADYLPVNPEDYIVNYISLGSVMEEGIEKLNLLLVGVPKIIVEGHLNLLKNLGLKPNVLDFAGNTINKLIFKGEKINNFYDNDGTIACIDLGFEGTGLTIIKDGFIKVSRTIEVGSKDMINNILANSPDIDESDLLDKIDEISDISEEISLVNEQYKLFEGLKSNLRDMFDRIEMIFRYYKTREIGNDIDLVILHGGMSNIKGVERLFSSYFDKPCIKLDSLSKVKFDGDLSKYANAIGGLIRLSEV